VLLGVVVAAYLVLSLFDHAARADVGSIDQPADHIGVTDPAGSIKVMVAGANKDFPEPKSINPKSTAPTALPRPTIKVSEVHSPSIRAGEAVRVQVRTPKVGQLTFEAVRDVARAGATPALSAVVRPKPSTSAQRSSLPLPAELPELPQAELPALPRLSSWLQLPGLPQAQVADWLPLPGPPQAQLPHWPQLPWLPQARMPTVTHTAAALTAPPAPLPLMQACALPPPPAFAPASGLPGVTKPPAAQAQPQTGPLPVPPQQPADRSTSTGQARDSGGSNAPAMGTVSSSWWAEVVAVGRRLDTDLSARGRTVRYAGPPS
jgi:hypothetical protein